MPTLFRPGDGERLPLGLTSDSSVEDFYHALKEVVKSHTSEHQSSASRQYDIFKDNLDEYKAKIISQVTKSGKFVTALHIDYLPRGPYTPIKTKFNIYTDIGNGGITALQVDYSEIYKGYKINDAYSLEYNHLYGMHSLAEWQELYKGLKLMEF